MITIIVHADDGHNVDSIDALMIVPPVAIAHMHSSPADRAEAIKVITGYYTALCTRTRSDLIT
jgi:hypothetical protein